MDGADWAYAVLVKIALHGNEKRPVRERAVQFTKDVLDDCFIRALVDIDWYPNSNKQHAFAIVRDVCKELSDEVR